jgi:maltooligosyltrehalose trehalohydrolase
MERRPRAETAFDSSPEMARRLALVPDEQDETGQTLGATRSGEYTRFRLFTTTATTCQVRLFDGNETQTHLMLPVGGGYFEVTVATGGAEPRYMFVLDGRELPDPYARFLPWGVHGPAVAFRSQHTWRNDLVSRPLREHVIYELHVGTFTPEGTYAAAGQRLPDLAALGVTALELMPLASFAGRRGWGYDGVAPFAPFACYGTPDDLRAFVDDAHGHGIAVILDVVYNHFGAAGNYLPAYSPDYFTQPEGNGWGDAPNFEDPLMRRMVLDNARYWLEEFRFDGLRVDATHAIRDRSPRHILAELTSRVRQMEPPRLLIAEDERNDPVVLGRLGFDGVWADDFHHEVRVTLTGEQDGYYAAHRGGADELARTISGGWLYQGQLYPPTGKPRGAAPGLLPAEAFIYCIQNHDQVGNRAFGDRLCHVVSTDAYCAASALLLLLPMTPLMFMGQEWAASTPFQYFTDHDEELGRKVSAGRRAEFAGFPAFSDPILRQKIPDPQEEATFQRSKLRWSERGTGDHARVLDLYRKLIALRRSDPVLSAAGREALEVAAHGDVLAVRRWSDDGDRLLLVNLGSAASPLEELASFVWRRPVLLRTDDRPPPPNAIAGHSAVLLGGRL